MTNVLVSMVLAGPVDLDFDDLVPDLLRLGLVLLAALLALIVTSAVLLTVVTVALTHLRGRRKADQEGVDC